MTPARWQQVQKLFDTAVELGPARSTPFLAAACAGDEELRREVEELLACEDRARSFLEQPALETAEWSVPAQLRPGEQLGRYRILEHVGAGGMGEVYSAMDTRLERKVAIKLLPRRFAADTQALERFQREARAESSLNHPNICTVHDVGEREGQPFLVMELLEGQSLKERLAAGSLGIDEVVALGVRLAAALEAAHSKGVVHRDIKPANIFITGPGEAKILDFGLAKLLPEPATPSGATTRLVSGETVSAGRVMGTLAYMSPEQARGEPVDQRTDLFSLGVTLYQMATAALPFQGDTPLLLLEAILNHQPLRPREQKPAVPPELERVILKALEKDRTRRYQTAAELRADLERLQPAGRHSGKTVAMAGLALAMLAVTVAGIWYTQQRTPATSQGLLACAESGTGQTYVRACVSRHGNLFSFESPRSSEHIRVGFWWEGYSMCYSDPTGARRAVYDVGQLDSGWAEPYRVEGTAFPTKIYRKTLGGRVELVQEFASGPQRDVTITMTVYNRSSQVLSNVVLERHADIDVDNTWANEWSVQPPHQATARRAGRGGHAVSMTNLTTDVRSEILLEKTDLWYEQQHYRGCQMVSQFATPADNLGTVRYHLGEMSPSESRTVKIVYRVTT